MAVIQEECPSVQSLAIFSFLFMLTCLETLPSLLTLRTLYAEDSQTYNFNSNSGWSSRLAYPTACLTPTLECLIGISSLICLKLVSGIISSFSKPVPLEDFPISGNGNSYLPVVRAKNFENILGFSLSLASHASLTPVGFVSSFKLC